MHLFVKLFFFYLFIIVKRQIMCQDRTNVQFLFSFKAKFEIFEIFFTFLASFLRDATLEIYPIQD